MEKYISEIDSNRFGFKIAKINQFSSTIENDLLELRKIGVKLIISRVNSNDIALINRLEDLNFRIKDTQLTFLHDLKNIDEIKNGVQISEKLKIELAEHDDIGRVGEIAHESFKGYGHYAANDKLDIETVNEIYRDWAEKSCSDTKIADYMFLAKIADEIAGFLSLKIMKEDDKKFGVQHLGAIDKGFRNFDIFRHLIIKCLEVGRANNHDWQQTYLLSTNIPVMRSYLKLGFKISDSNHTMHCWL